MSIKRIILSLLLVMLLLLVTGCGVSTSSKYEAASKLLAEEKYDEAIAAFSEIKYYENTNKYIMYIQTIQLAEVENTLLQLLPLKRWGIFVIVST